MMQTNYVTLSPPFAHRFPNGCEVKNIRFSSISAEKLRKIETITLWANNILLEKIIYDDFNTDAAWGRKRIPLSFLDQYSDYNWTIPIPFGMFPLYIPNNMTVCLKMETDGMTILSVSAMPMRRRGPHSSIHQTLKDTLDICMYVQRRLEMAILNV